MSQPPFFTSETGRSSHEERGLKSLGLDARPLAVESLLA